MQAKTLVLVLVEQAGVRNLLVENLRAADPQLEVIGAATVAEARRIVVREEVAVFLCAQDLEELDEKPDRKKNRAHGVDVIEEARAIRPEMAAILLVDRQEWKLVEKMAIAGVFRCVPAPCGMFSLMKHVRGAIDENHRSTRVAQALQRVL